MKHFITSLVFVLLLAAAMPVFAEGGAPGGGAPGTTSAPGSGAPGTTAAPGTTTTLGPAPGSTTGPGTVRQIGQVYK